MQITDSVARQSEAGIAFDEHERRGEGSRIVNNLSDGCTTLRNLLFRRIHEDVETAFGTDSMLIPVSPHKRETQAKVEIELFQVAEAVRFIRAHDYVSDADWFAEWFGQLRLGEFHDDPQAVHRLDQYAVRDADQRRHHFARKLEGAYPEARKVPLVIYRLYPLSVGLAIAIAFGDNLHAAELRNQQIHWLPSIQDCHECHGRPLDNGEKCQVCGNPIWTYKWLTSVE